MFLRRETNQKGEQTSQKIWDFQQ